MAAPDERFELRGDSLDVADWRRTTRALQQIAWRIVGDAARSEDIVQSAWVSALEHGGGAPRRGWLRRLVQHRSIDARRKQRGLPPHTPVTGSLVDHGRAADELAARIEVQRAVLDAVEALDEHYRATVYLRYFEGLSIGEIAARMGVPTKTVETRLTRALAELRRRLASRARDEDGAGWASALVLFGRSASEQSLPLAPSITPLVLASTLAMKKLAVLLVIAVAAVAGWYVVGTSGGHPEPVTHVPVIASEPQADQGVQLEVLDGTASVVRSTVDVETPPVPKTSVAHSATEETGALTVTVRWSDGTPAADVGVLASSDSRRTGVSQRTRQVTDPSGIARFAALPIGDYQLSTLWNQQDARRRVRATVVANATTPVTIELAEGLVVEGRVASDSGVGVAGARIWLAAGHGRWASGAVVATADGNGNYRLRDVPLGVSVGALATGHLPSDLVDLDVLDTSVSSVKIDFVVSPGGGTLEGSVTDEDGKPVVDALVVAGTEVGSSRFRMDGSVPERWTQFHTTTDDEGHYRFDVMRTGIAPVHVRGRGFAQWQGEIDVRAGGAERLDIRLERGATVTGIVTDSQGIPVEGARIQAFEQPLPETYLQTGQIDFDGPIAQQNTLTGADGSYSLSLLPRRIIHLYALQRRIERNEIGEAEQFVHTELDLRSGGPKVWNPVLSDGRTIRGIVRYRDGAAIPEIFVEAIATAGVDPYRRATHTTDGTFRFIQLPGEKYTIRAQIHDLPKGHDAPHCTDVSPDGEPIELIATFDAPRKYEPSEVRVRFEDVGGRADDATPSVCLERLDRFARHFGKSDVEGAWRFVLDEPGRFRPIALLDQRVIAAGEAFDFTPGKDLDLGTLASEPGSSLVVEWSMPDQLRPEGLTVYLRPEATQMAEELTPAPASRIRFESLQPGPGKLTFHARNILDVEVPYDALVGEETVVKVAFVPAVKVPYSMHLPTYEDPVSFACRIIDVTTGERLQDVEYKDYRRFPNPVKWSRQLGKGTYRLEVVLGDGKHAETTFTVPSLEPSEAPSPALDLR